MLSPVDLHQQAKQFFIEQDYIRAAEMYESLAEADPTVRVAGWYLGLIRFLQGRDDEAHLIWSLAIAHAEPEETDRWTDELIQVLQQEAERQEALEEMAIAWAIRRQIQDLQPTNRINTLHVIRLSLPLKTLMDEDLILLQEQLTLYPLIEDERELLDQTLVQLLEQLPQVPLVAELVTSVLPSLPQSTDWIERLLAVAMRLHYRMSMSRAAYPYAQLAYSLQSDRPDILYHLCCICQDSDRYQEGIELALRYYHLCQTLIQQIIGNTLVLRGLMNTGTRWQEAEVILQQQTALLQTLLAAPPDPSPSPPLDISLLCTPMIFYLYLRDQPRVTRSLQNQVAARIQASVNATLTPQLPNYQSYALSPSRPPLQRSRSPIGRLRIGYLSRFFYRHSIGWLARWLIRYFDRDRFDLHTYLIQPTEIDGFAEEWYIQTATHSRTLEDNAVDIARTIQQDGIDILVDLDSLTSPPIAQVMTLKPAPIQVTWLGLDASGLPTIDYFLADPYVLPDDAQEYYQERIWRLPATYIAVDGFEVGIPTLHRDRLQIPADAVIYLSSQFAYKRHPATLALQMQILQQVPNSYFLVKGLGDKAALQAMFTEAAIQAGVSPDRLRFLPRDPDEETHRANLAIADIVLDTYPYNGATTTLETLWMGIPLVTRVGQQFAARNSYTMMVNAGIHEGIAWSDAEYVDWGVRFGQDADLREQVALKLARSRQTAPLWNGRQFTRDVEAAYQQMWAIYTGQQDR